MIVETCVFKICVCVAMRGIFQKQKYIDLVEPCSVHPLCFTLPALLVKWRSLIDHLFIDFHWVRHRNLLSDRVSAGLPPHSTPLGLVQVYCTSLPLGLVWVCHHTSLPLIYSSWWLATTGTLHGMSSDSPKPKTKGKCSTT